ncbi:hypothetical protein [Leucobacter triazinivorans]|uniref:Uncharacterized protein n=1 Tax=Leucobacter triazinivorans TaxID=1784719 RepID=A0A4P6KEZ7_9MICO|nr:hypothetical protein [Leucobacter triazinivorans]QBE48986.1 hypothetical protein EVS81_09165 [Leucobacter triazinivorans]
MNTPARLGIYGLGLVVLFGAAFAVAGAVVPSSAVEARIAATAAGGHDDVRTAQAGGFDVELTGDLVVGGSSTLSLEVTRDGEPVTEMQPYPGAFGHLVALREGDLAYLRVHPEGDEPEAGDMSGPTVDFATEAPTAGRYLLSFDFQVGDEVHTAAFALTTAEGEAPEGADHDDSH